MTFYREHEFQVTDVGKIPKEWTTARLSDLGEVSTGKTPATANSGYWAGNIPFVTPADMDETKCIYRTERKITQEGATQTKILPKNTVLVVCIGSTIGKVALTCQESATNQQINSIISENANPEFLYYSILRRASALKAMSGIAAVPIIKKSLFEQFKVALPPKPEQNKIAEVLGAADAAIELADRVIAKCERLKRGLMQQLLTRGIGHTETKQTPIGKLPVNWEVTELGNLGELQYGYTASTVKEHTGVKFLRITDIEENGRIDWGKVPYCNIPKQDIEKFSLKKGDILFARIGATAGKTALVEENVCGVFASYLIRLKTKEAIHPHFAFYFTQSEGYWSQALRQREGQLKKGINATMLSKFAIPLPPLEEQKKIAEILSVTDHKLFLEREERNRIEDIKRGLMDLLLTGKVRVRMD